VVAGAEVCHPIDHGCGGSEPHRAEGADEVLRVPLPEPWRRGRRLLWRSSRGRQERQGGVNKGPTSCTGKPYWGAAKKTCWVDQYEAPPMYGLWKDNQYKAPPREGLKDEHGVLPMSWLVVNVMVLLHDVEFLECCRMRVAAWRAARATARSTGAAAVPARGAQDDSGEGQACQRVEPHGGNASGVRS
jgi:hypothetical protein